MLLAFVITVHMSTGQILTTTKQAITLDHKPINKIVNCHRYAKQMQDRLNVSISEDKNINRVIVTCQRLPKHQVITNYSHKHTKNRSKR